MGQTKGWKNIIDWPEVTHYLLGLALFQFLNNSIFLLIKDFLEHFLDFISFM